MRETLGRAGQERLVASEGVVGAGTVFYEEVVSRQLEGVMATLVERLGRSTRIDRRAVGEQGVCLEHRRG